MEERKGYKKGLWTVEEDRILIEYIRVHGKGRWNRVAKMTGLKRCGKSCRLRWMNYLSPSIKRGCFSEEEDDLIIRLHNLLGNRWSLIAGRVPGRTDNQVKNHWNGHLSKKLGFNNSKTKLGASSQTTPIEVEEDCRVPLDTNSKKQHFDGNGGGPDPHDEKKLNKDGYPDHSKVGFFDMDDPTINGVYHESSFWFSSEDFSVRSPSLMELLDQCSPEFVWHGL